MTENGALHRVHWDFGRSNFHSLTITIKIYNEPDAHVRNLKGGSYFQMYHGWCNGVGFYFGIQTDVHRKGYGYTGKGLIFSRWNTKDPSNVRVSEGGWVDCG